MGLVSVSLNGRPYEISCDDGQEDHVTHLADVLNQRVSALAETVGQVGESRLLVMAGLLVADELVEARAGLDNLASRLTGAGLLASSAAARGAGLLEGSATAPGGGSAAEADLVATINELARHIEGIVESLRSS